MFEPLERLEPDMPNEKEYKYSFVIEVEGEHLCASADDLKYLIEEIKHKIECAVSSVLEDETYSEDSPEVDVCCIDTW